DPRHRAVDGGLHRAARARRPRRLPRRRPRPAPLGARPRPPARHGRPRGALRALAALAAVCGALPLGGGHVRFARVATPIGELTLVATDTGLREVRWPGEAPPSIAVEAPPDDPVLVAAAGQLRAWFAGERTAFDLPLDL